MPAERASGSDDRETGRAALEVLIEHYLEGSEDPPCPGVGLDENAKVAMFLDDPALCEAECSRHGILVLENDSEARKRIPYEWGTVTLQVFGFVSAGEHPAVAVECSIGHGPGSTNMRYLLVTKDADGLVFTPWFESFGTVLPP